MAQKEYIKKAFEQMKKDLKKERGISGGFYMNNAQIANRTATWRIINTASYESEIDLYTSEIKWYAERGWDKSEEGARELLARAQKGLKTYGNKITEARALADEVINSEAVRKFGETVGREIVTRIEEQGGWYYLRIYY